MSDRWETGLVASRLVRLDSRSGEVIWTQAAGFVRARCLLAGKLWDFTPVTGSWAWLMAGRNDEVEGLWKVTFADGVNAPECVTDHELSAHSALWEAVYFLDSDIERHMVEREAAGSLARDERTPDADRTVPSLTLERFVIAANEGARARALATAFLDESRASWRGAPNLLTQFGVGDGEAVRVDALTQALAGRHVADHDRQVREPTMVALRLPDEPRTGEHREADATSRVSGFVQLRGVLHAPDGVNEAWRIGSDAERRAIEGRLLDGADISIQAAAHAEHVAAATTLTVSGELADARLEVRWIAVGADRGGGVASPCEPRCLTSAAVEIAEFAAAEPLQGQQAEAAATIEVAEQVRALDGAERGI